MSDQVTKLYLRGYFNICVITQTRVQSRQIYVCWFFYASNLHELELEICQKKEVNEVFSLIRQNALRPLVS